MTYHELDNADLDSMTRQMPLLKHGLHLFHVMKDALQDIS